MPHAEHLSKIKLFLEKLEIEVHEREVSPESFLPGLELGPNCVYVDSKKLKYPGDLLHEAGHLAVTTPEQRSRIGTEQPEESWPTEGEEIAAILWSYAAAQEIGLPLDILFHENGYKGSSEWLIDTFESGNYIGLPFLEWTGMAYGPKLAGENNARPFPEMVKWIRE